jgi:hypothetical protein
MSEFIESPYLIRIDTTLGRVDVEFPETPWDEPVETTMVARTAGARLAMDEFMARHGVGVTGVRFDVEFCSPVDLVRTLEVNASYHRDPLIVGWGVEYGALPDDDGQDTILESVRNENGG